MSAVILAAGLGDVSLDDVRQLVDDPDKAVVRKTNIYDVPPYALYLTDVEYDAKGTNRMKFETE
jgi:tRNA U38,U39,U40 pseudouridine synthase TruA